MIFQGIRVIDLSMGWAGPLATRLLGEMGAEIIKVESCQRPDWWRGGLRRPETPQDKPYENSPHFNSANLGKYGITLDLATPEGIDIFKRLVKIGDIVIENYTPRVMKNLGLDYPVLSGINPSLIMISLPLFGTTGPWCNYTAYGQTTECLCGTGSVTGYTDGPPRLQSMGYDPVSALYANTAILMALHHRLSTGEGQFIDLSQVESDINLVGGTVMDYSMNKRPQSKIGNRHPSMAPHGCYRCKGEDSWIAIAVSNDREWENFCTAIGNPPWTKESRFSDSLSRWKDQDGLDILVEQWTSQYDHYEAMQILQKAGVPAGAVLPGEELLSDPHLQERGFFQEITRAHVGTHPYPGLVIRLSETPGAIRGPAPCLGEHNEYILNGLLGISHEDIEKLEQKKIIGIEPIMQVT